MDQVGHSRNVSESNLTDTSSYHRRKPSWIVVDDDKNSELGAHRRQSSSSVAEDSKFLVAQIPDLEQNKPKPAAGSGLKPVQTKHFKSGCCISVSLLVFLAALAVTFAVSFTVGSGSGSVSSSASEVVPSNHILLGLEIDPTASSALAETAYVTTPAQVQSSIAGIAGVPLSYVSVTNYTSTFYNVTCSYGNTTSSSPVYAIEYAAKSGDWRLLVINAVTVTNLETGSDYAVCWTCGTVIPYTGPPTKAPTVSPTSAPTTQAPTVAPTVTPTAAPTSGVTVAPTAAPTTAAPTTASPTTAAPTAALP